MKIKKQKNNLIKKKLLLLRNIYDILHNSKSKQNNLIHIK